MVLSEWTVVVVMDSSAVGWEWETSTVTNKFQIDLGFLLTLLPTISAFPSGFHNDILHEVDKRAYLPSQKLFLQVRKLEETKYMNVLYGIG